MFAWLSLIVYVLETGITAYWEQYTQYAVTILPRCGNGVTTLR